MPEKAYSKTRPNNESEYYVVRTCKQAADTVKSAIKENLKVLNQNYVKKTVDTGKEILDGIGQDAQKLINLSKKRDSQDRNASYFVIRTIENASNNVTSRIRKNYNALNNNYIQKGIATSKEVSAGIEEDARKLVNNVVDSGKRLREKISIDYIEDKVAENLNALRGKVNLPSKDDMEKLTKTMDILTSKVDALTKQYTA